MAHVSWLTVRVSSCLALFYVYQTNHMYSCNDFVIMKALQTLSEIILLLLQHTMSKAE